MCGFLTLWGVGPLNPFIVQGLTVYTHEDKFYLWFLFSQSYLRMWLCVPLQGRMMQSTPRQLANLCLGQRSWGKRWSGVRTKTSAWFFSLYLKLAFEHTWLTENCMVLWSSAIYLGQITFQKHLNNTITVNTCKQSTRYEAECAKNSGYYYEAPLLASNIQSSGIYF